MATISQGINKITVVKKQTGIGVPASGSGGQILRREKSDNKLTRDSFANNEINSAQQGTGKTPGLRKVDASVSAVLSPGTYSTLLASILRKDFAATTPLTATGVTIATGALVGGLQSYTLTIAAGSFLTNGFKILDVIRLTVGSLDTANLNKNLQIINLTATVATVLPVNGAALVAEGPIAGCTLSLPGKKSVPPISGHTRDYWTVEDWKSDIETSEVYTDVVWGGADFNFSPTGNATLSLMGAGRDRSTGTTQILTTPTAETTSNVMSAVNGILIVNGLPIGNVSGASVKIDGKAASMGAVVGSDITPDIQRGRIDVSGQFTAFDQDAVLPTLFDDATPINLSFVIADSQAKDADFVAVSMSSIILEGDTADDGEKGLIRTYPFTARMNPAGGAALASDKAICFIQDSLA